MSAKLSTKGESEMNINQTVAGFELGQLLQLEPGVFDLKSENGRQRLQVTSANGVIALSGEPVNNRPKNIGAFKPAADPWHITKIAELQTQPPGG